VTLPFYIRKYLKAKEECYGNSNISPCKPYNLGTKPVKERNQNPSRYYNTIITKSQVSTQAKI
jgi:hypothetical protein